MHIRDLFKGSLEERQRVEGSTLWDLVKENPPVNQPDDVDLQEVYTRLPGDTKHPWWVENPYLRLSFAEIKELMQYSHSMAPEQRKLLHEAYGLFQAG